MKIILVTHPSRAPHVALLQRSLDVAATVVDTVSAKSGHMAALRLAAQLDERVVIMEDDAIPVKNFDELSDYWAILRPNDLISFYLGTSRPRELQNIIAHKIAVADQRQEADIWLPHLIHGVCYSVPTAGLAPLIEKLDKPSRVREADYAIGVAWGREMCYPLESLVQHRDEAPVEQHPDGLPRQEPRVARRLAGSLMYVS